VHQFDQGFQDLGADGLAHLRGLSALTSLDLENTRVGDGGLAHLSRLKLDYLCLSGTQITDAGLSRLGGLLNLTTLSPSGSGISDPQLANLSELENHIIIDAHRIKVARAGVAAMQRRLPKIEIRYREK
jgi:hypothetical protein